MRMIRSKVALATGLRLTGNLNREAVLRMARITLTDRAIWPRIRDIVTSFTALFGTNNRLKDCPVSGSIEPELISMLRLGVLGHFFFVTLRAIFRCRVESNSEAIVLKGIKVVLFSLVTGKTTDTIFCMLRIFPHLDHFRCHPFSEMTGNALLCLLVYFNGRESTATEQHGQSHGQ